MANLLITQPLILQSVEKEKNNSRTVFDHANCIVMHNYNCITNCIVMYMCICKDIVLVSSLVHYILKSCCYTFVQYIKETLVPPSKAFKTLLIPSYNTFVRRCQYPLTIYIQDIDTSVQYIMETFWIPPCNTFGIICWYICISIQYFREKLIPLYNTLRRHC